MKQVVRQAINEYKKTFKELTDNKDIADWASSLHYELNIVKETLDRRRMEDKFDYFLRRLVSYKSEFPHLGTSGDFTLIKRIILAEIRLDEMDEMDVSEIAELPKTIDAFTRLHTQLMKDIESIGATSRQKKKETLDVMRIIINHKELQGVSESEQESVEWMRGKIPIPE